VEISTTSRGKAIVMAVSGRVDAATAPQFEAKILELIASGQLRLVIDLGNLEYINSAGLRTLLVAGKRLKPQGGRLLLAAPREPVRRVLQISGFSTMFETCATGEEALARACADD
jgi:anti-sigma B factor antagonist